MGNLANLGEDAYAAMLATRPRPGEMVVTPTRDRGDTWRAVRELHSRGYCTADGRLTGMGANVARNLQRLQ